MTLQQQIQKKVDFLSEAEKRLAQYILSDNTAAVLTTTGDLARACYGHEVLRRPS
jgi:DNA-binding MurR/RpiR family transcriptional regulator